MAGYSSTEIPVALAEGETAPASYHIVGTFSAYAPREMLWNGKSFEYLVTVGMRQWESFQILMNADWQTRVYPSVKSANPSKEYVLCGPDEKGHGYDWVMGRAGFNPFGYDLIAPGTMYTVNFFVDPQGNPARLTWSLYEDAVSAASAHDGTDDDGGDDDGIDEDAPTHKYHIAGSWDDWKPEAEPMKWDGECFWFVVRLGGYKKEYFQILQDRSWDTVVYPSVDKANPYIKYEMRGPDGDNTGLNWGIGKTHELPGTRYKIKLFLDRQGKPHHVAWDVFNGSKAEKSTVICVAGLASSCLEMKRGSGYTVNWCNVKRLIANPKRVFKSLKMHLTDGTLKDGTAVKCTANAEGFEVRSLKGVIGVKDLNPTGVIPVPVWGPLIDNLAEDFNWHSFDYDWRRWGDLVFAEEVVERLRTFVEETLEADGTSQVSFIGHSMGASVILYALSMLDDDWVQKHVSHVILVAPAHLGAPSMATSFAHCPFVDTQSWLPVPKTFDQKLGDLTATWACMIAELPMDVGGIQSWPEDYVFATTPDREYKLADMGQFLDDLADCKTHREFGPALIPGVLQLAASMKAPVVQTTVIYASGTETPYQVEYESSDLGAAPKLKSTQPGDGTVIAASLEAWGEATDVLLLKEPGASATSHKELIVSEFTIAMVPRILRSEKLTPISVTIVSASGLMNKDNRWFNDLSDPYCIFEIKGKPATRRQTEVIWDNLDPEWNHEAVIYAYCKGDELTFNVHDMDTGLTQGDFLGRAVLSSDQIEEGFEGSLNFKNGYQGSLLVRVSKMEEICV